MSQSNPYTANVNRAKTKKWVEAKSYSYDGDDWGEVDDYDEYGGYDEPEPEPAPKPTGLRQRGQSASQVPQEAYEDRQDFYQSPIDSRQPYGNMNGQPSQQQHEGRSSTNPRPHQKPGMMRSNSFDRDDERRAFSAGGPQQDPSGRGGYKAPSSQDQNRAAQDYQAVQPPSITGPPQPSPARPPLHVPDRSNLEAQARDGEQIQSAGGNYRGKSYTSKERQAQTGSRTQSMTSNNSGLEFNSRRDFSPSAVPPPLQTRGSPSPHHPDSRSSSRHPPRKSSLGQDNAPVEALPAQAPSFPVTKGAEDDNSFTRDRAGSGAAKSLPFVRPADIYRRMQEEKEKERQSQDSSRPSMEAILGRPNERPALARSQDSESSQRLKPALDPVTERRSEYGMEGLSSEDQETLGDRRPTSSKKFNFPEHVTNNSSLRSQSSLGPMLPDVSRVSGFGESFFGSADNTGDGSRGLMLNFENPSSPQLSQRQDESSYESGLQHQPSLGFTSAVHQAFDKAEDQVPPTPNSTHGSSVARSTSGGTSTVSPIISRGPSTTTENRSARLPGIDNISTPMILEGPEGGSSRPLSSRSAETPTQVSRKPPPVQSALSEASEERPPSFIPGYRRNSDTPSPDNSPRRTPALETNRPLRQPQEIELAEATPTNPSSSAEGNSSASEAVLDEELNRGQSASAGMRDRRGPYVDTQAGHRSLNQSADSPGSTMSPVYDHLRGRTDSSSPSRVRNLADKFESVSRPGSAHSTTPRASMLGANAQKKDDLAPPRPLVDHRESFRPHLPGGWESSASIAPAFASKESRVPFSPRELDQYDPRAEPAPASATNVGVSSEGTVPSAVDQHPSSVTQIKDASEEAFAAVAAAGSALFAAFGAAVGVEQHDSPANLTRDASTDEPVSLPKSEDLGPQAHGRGALYPEASRPHVPPLSDDEVSTAAPTPLPKSTSLGLAEQSPGYFSSSSREHNGETSAHPVDEPRRQPPTLSPLSTDNGSEQYESDRLRKEIVRELTPMSASQPTTAGTDYSEYQPTLSTNPSVTRPGHESGVLPKEYESYWNDANSDDEVDDIQREPAHVEGATTAERLENAAVAPQPLQLSQGHQHLPQPSAIEEGAAQGRPQMLPHRFSWEQPLQNLSAEPISSQVQPMAPTSSFLKSAVYPEGHPIQPQEEPTQAYMAPTVRTVVPPPVDEFPSVPDKDLSVHSSREGTGPRDGATDAEKELPSRPIGPEVAPSGLAKQLDESPNQSQVDGMNKMSPHSPIVHSSAIREFEPARSEPPTPITPSRSAQTIDPAPMPSLSNALPKVPAFREILALRNPNDRIRAYNEARDQFANLNIGLAHWIAVTTNDLPEHADLLASSGRPAPIFQGHKPSQSRSKLGGLLPSGGQSGQQPYFQQYLNANQGQALAQDGNVQGTGIGGGSSQGLSPSGTSGGKLSSQQVQAKGKDLLHTAGVFGGKANVAAKGLFSKGKSKLRAASGNEKATSRLFSGPEPFRGMQQQLPIAQSHNAPQTSAEPRTVSSGAVSHAPSPVRQDSYQSPQLKSPQDAQSDTPSVESFTQSQLGDDERSEESEPLHQYRPPRGTSLPSKQGVAEIKSDQSVQNPVIVGDNAPIFLQGTPSADSYVGSPREIHTPRSTTSSHNRTPTQASFAIGTPQKQWSGDSKTTIRNLRDDRTLDESTTVPSKSPSVTKDDRELISRAPARMSALAASEILPTAPNVRKSGPKSPRSRPVSSSRDSLGVPGVSRDRVTSIDSLPDPLDPDRPPSPISIDGPAPQEALEQRGRPGPIHYGVEHDFVTDSDHERISRRTRSYSRTSADRRPSQSIDHRPTFNESDDMPSQLYSGKISRGNSPAPLQQAPEYRIEGVSPPIEWPAESSSRSRRGSRSSAFFRSLNLGSSSKLDEPPLPSAPNDQTASSPVASAGAGERVGKRASILRSLTGHSGSGSAGGQSRTNVTPAASVLQQTQPIQAASTNAPQVEDDEFPSRGNSRSAASKLTKRLQRSSTSGKAEQATGTKKRFSAIGSLFGRGSPKRQSSLANPPTPSQQPPPTRQSQQNSSYAVDPPPHKPRQLAFDGPNEDYVPPPPGGYYAPRSNQIRDTPPLSGPRLQQDERSSSWVQDAPAYVQDKNLRQRVDQPPPAPTPTPPRSSLSFSQTAPQHSPASLPRSSTVRNNNYEPVPERSTHVSKPSGSSWTRFSQHGRSKSRQTDSSAPPSHALSMAQQPYRDPSRPESPPPPPPPPKDVWHQARPQQSMSSDPAARSSHHGPSPSQSSHRPTPSPNRQSLPPLQTNVSNKKRQGTAASGKSLTPEEKRKSRQLEIERSTISPHYREEIEEEPPVVMSATSFPGQMWQPEYAHWEGD